MLTEAMLRRLWPRGDSRIPGLIDGVIASAPATLSKYGLVTPLLVAHFMAQVSHECGAGLEVEENLNYTAQGIVRVWPSRFSSIVAAAPYAHNPQKLANNVYGSRMGNRPDSNDGWDFRGRGATQTTGREGYAKLAARVGLDLVATPDLINNRNYFLECGAADFVLCGCLPFAARDDIRGATHHLNGGYIGLDQREEWLTKWKAALEATQGPIPALTAPDGAIRYGDKGWQVKAIQEQLIGLGYHLGSADGDFGSDTRAAVLAFQANEALPHTGEVDTVTKESLTKAPSRPVAVERMTATVDDLRDSGSTTIASADGASLWGKIKIGAGTLLASGGAASQVDVLDSAQMGLDKVHQAQGIWGQIHDYVTPLLGHPSAIFFGLLLVGSGVFVCWIAENIRQQRLADHQSGVNLGR